MQLVHGKRSMLISWLWWNLSCFVVATVVARGNLAWDNQPPKDVLEDPQRSSVPTGRWFISSLGRYFFLSLHFRCHRGDAIEAVGVGV
jgi:hypothetical protein